MIVVALETGKFLRMTRRFSASPERVFDAWLDPDQVRQWLFTAPSDERSTLDIDARVGGTWRITTRREGVDYAANGEYLEIDRPHRLVFTFAMPQFSPNADRLIVEIESDGSGSIITFSQVGVDIDDELRQLEAGKTSESEQGWGYMFQALAAVLGEPA
jgi:uncharacterized protein YndB with AHSA1/START domain